METKELVRLNESEMVPTKAYIKDAATKLVERVEDGYMNPLLAFGQLYALGEIVEQAKDKIKELAKQEAEKYEGGGKPGFDAFGCGFQIAETGVKYDYSENECWQKLNEAVKVATAELKGQEALQKELGQYSRSSTTTIKVTLKK